MSQLGEIYSLQGRYNEAEVLLKEVLATRIRVQGKEHPDTLESMCILGWEYVYQKVGKRFDKSAVLFANALEVGRRELGEDNDIVLNAMHGLAFQYTLAYRFDEAKLLSRKGLEISNRVRGKEHHRTIAFMNMIAWVCGQQELQESYEPALELVTEALEIGRRVLGDKHLNTVYALNSLGWLYYRLGRYDEALQPLVRSVELCHQVINEAHPASLYLMNRLQALYRERSQHEEADDLLCKIVEISQRVHGLDYLHTKIYRGKLIGRTKQLGSLGIQQYNAHSCQDAFATFRKIVNIDQVLDRESETLTHGYLAMCLHQLGRRNEAENYLHQVRRKCQRVEQTSDETLLCRVEKLFADKNSEAHQAWAAIEGGRLEQAQKILQQIRELTQEDSYTSRGGIQSISRALARSICRAALTARHSDEGIRKRIALYEAALQADPNCIPALRELARLLAVRPEVDLRDGTKALLLAQRACELTDHQECRCLVSLAAAYAENGDFQAAAKWQREAIKHLPQGRSPHEFKARLDLYASAKHLHAEYVQPLVAWWKCEMSDGQQIRDFSGNGLHGKLVGDANIVFDSDRGYALRLDGQKDWVDCGSDIRFNLGDQATICAWIKVTEFDKPHQFVIAKGAWTWRMQRNGRTDTINVACNGLTVLGDWKDAIIGTKKVNDGQWHHVVGVYDGVRVYQYIDAELDALARAWGRIDINSHAVYIGANSENDSYEWNGLIDDVRIYNYALSEGEIRSLYGDKEPEKTRR